MAFFAESTVQESYQDLGIVVNDYTDFDMLAMEACETIQEMDNAIMTGIGRYELAQVREGAEVVYTEGMLETIKGKISKIWEFVKNWVKSVWNKFVAWVSSYVRGDKSFLQKYEKQIKENVGYLSEDFEYRLHGQKSSLEAEPGLNVDVKVGSANKLVSEYVGKIIGAAKGDAPEFGKIVEELDEKLDEYKEALKEAPDREEVNKAWVKSNLDKIINMVKFDASKLDKAVKNIEKGIESSKKAAIDGASKVEEGNRSAAIDKIKSVSNKVASFYSFSTSVYIKAIKAAKSDARAICRKIVTAKPNPKYNESAFDHNDFEAYFNI